MDEEQKVNEEGAAEQSVPQPSTPELVPETPDTE